MKLYLTLAWRNVWRNRRRTLIVMLAMGLGLGLLIFYDGFIEGAGQAIFGNAVRLQGGNIQIHAPGYRKKYQRMPLLPMANADEVIQTALAQPGVISASRRINTGGMASNREGQFSISITGIEPDVEGSYGLIAENISAGRFLRYDDLDYVLIGEGLAEEMNVWVGDRIIITGRGAHEQMRRRTMTIVGVYSIGLTVIEKQTVYISLKEAQGLFHLRDQSTEVIVALGKVGMEDALAPILQAALPEYEVDSWVVYNPEIKQTMDLDKAFMEIFGIIMLFIAGIGILNILLMSVFERTREIGLLGALGVRPRQIMLLFFSEGVILGMLGAIAGMIVGLLMIAYFATYGMDYSQFAEMTEVTALIGQRAYATLAPSMMIRRAIMVFIMAVLAAWYPARVASRREPAEALHHV
ncbi:MAG: ABC transporter permease [Chloroflexi bacterium]|nr:ABC transporter permease [Chloroflexota bacterium]